MVKGDHAIYDNALFGYEREPLAGWLGGRLTCSYIDELQREYDDRQADGKKPLTSNHIPIISRTRKAGLAPTHPFSKRLGEAVDRVLQELVEKEKQREQEAKNVESSNTRRSFSRMAREASRIMQEWLQELEMDDPPGNDPGTSPDFEFRPPVLKLAQGDERTVSIVARAEGLREQEEVVVECVYNRVAIMQSGTSRTEKGKKKIPLQPGPSRPDLLRGQVRIRADRQGNDLLIGSLPGRGEAEVFIDVVPERDDPPQELPHDFSFERPAYRVTWNKNKQLVLYAPTDLVDVVGGKAHVESEDAGIVILGGGAISFRPTGEDKVMRATLRLEGRTLGSRSMLRARLGSATAETRVTVVQNERSNPEMEIRLDIADQNAKIFRGEFDPPEPTPDETQTLWIKANHPSVRPYLGEGYADQETLQFQAVAAEIVAETVVRRVMTRKYPDQVTSQELYYDHVEYASGLLPKLQQISKAGRLVS